MLIVFTTTPTKEEAEIFARKLVEEKLAACVQIVPQITSFYFWEGETQKDTEFLMLIKTLEEKFDDIKTFIESNHPYSVPEIVGVNAERVSEKYAAWMNESL